MQFTEVYPLFKSDIAVTALAQKVPGMDYDDVVSEMTICLWKACESYSHGATSLGAYWWSLWLNRKADLIRQWYASKRVHPILTDQVPEGSYTDPLPPDPPKKTGDVERLVWDLLAGGDEPKEVQDALGISRRRYYNTVHTWRTDSIADMLRDA